MKNFNRPLSVLIFIFLFFSFLLIDNQRAQAQNGNIYIYSPHNGDTLYGTVSVTGYVVGVTPTWIGLFLDDISTMAPGSVCPASTSFTCTWNTAVNGTALNGSHKLTAHASSDGISYTIVSDPPVSITISNGGAEIPPTPPSDGGNKTPTAKPTRSAWAVEPTTSPIASTPGPTPTPEMTTTLAPVPGRPDLSPIPVAVPAPTPSASLTPIDLVSDSKTLAAVSFDLDQDKPLHLEKIESRISTAQKKFLYFSGKSYPNSLVKLSVNSQPLVMTATADANGNWTYTLDKPMEPGQHETYVEVNNNGQVEQSGPYPFSIAKAQAGVTNPTGASLDLVDPQKEALKIYLYVAGGLVALALIILGIFLYLRKIKKLRTASPPLKEPRAI